jgi:hypothetical protein
VISSGCAFRGKRTTQSTLLEGFRGCPARSRGTNQNAAAASPEASEYGIRKPGLESAHAGAVQRGGAPVWTAAATHVAAGAVALVDPVGAVGLVDPVGAVGLVDPVGAVALVDPVGAVALVDPVVAVALVDPVVAVALVEVGLVEVVVAVDPPQAARTSVETAAAANLLTTNPLIDSHTPRTQAGFPRGNRSRAPGVEAQ